MTVEISYLLCCVGLLLPDVEDDLEQILQVHHQRLRLWDRTAGNVTSPFQFTAFTLHERTRPSGLLQGLRKSSSKRWYFSEPLVARRRSVNKPLGLP